MKGHPYLLLRKSQLKRQWSFESHYLSSPQMLVKLVHVFLSFQFTLPCLADSLNKLFAHFPTQDPEGVGTVDVVVFPVVC